MSLILPHRRGLIRPAAIVAAGAPSIQSQADMWFDGSDTSKVYQERSSPSTLSGANGVIGTWKNKGTLGASADLIASADAQRAIYRSAGYAEFDGSDDGLRTANGILNTGIVSYLVAFRRSNNGVICGHPELAASHSSPYFRTVLYGNGAAKIETRINGSSTNGTLTASTGVDYVSEFYSVDGDTYLNGALDINASGATITYTASVPFLLFQNAAGGECVAGRCYGLLAFSRDLTSGERAAARTYLGGLAGLSL